MSKLTWPAWFSSPDGKQSNIFEEESDVPKGWTSGAEKTTVSGKSPPTKTETAKETDTPKADAPKVDADGHTFDPEMHTGTLTKAGLWRMKVGVKRPDPVEALPLDL